MVVFIFPSESKEFFVHVRRPARRLVRAKIVRIIRRLNLRVEDQPRAFPDAPLLGITLRAQRFFMDQGPVRIRLISFQAIGRRVIYGLSAPSYFEGRLLSILVRYR